MRIVKPIQITDSILISSNVPENDFAAYSSTTGYNLKDKVMVVADHKNYEVIKQESSVVTVSGTPAVVSWSKHELSNGRQVKFSTTGTLPVGIVAGTTYYVINSAENSFNFSATNGGAAIDTASGGSGVHTATALVNNLAPATNPTYWLDIGATNRWKMFDKAVQSQTTATTTLQTKLTFPSYIDTVPLLNVTGRSVNLKITRAAEGTLYNKTIPLVTDETAIIDLFTYFFSGFKTRKDAIFDKIPPYANSEMTLTLTGDTGTTVGIGAAIFGFAKDISSTRMGVEQGARVGIDDYSIKTRNTFGDYVITERAFSKRANFTVYINNSELDDVFNFLTDIRSMPAIYLGSGKYTSAAVYGFYKNWEIDIAYPDFSVCSIELDGLT